MKLKFKHQPYQAAAVDAVADCFAGQPRSTGEDYRLDPGRAPSPQRSLLDDAGFRNHPIRLDDAALLANLQAAQRRANLALSDALVPSKASRLNLDIEMETGTGKTYVYIKTLFELHRRFGWGKFVIVVPSIAIREGVLKSFRITAEHFLADYGQRARFFVYDSRHLHQLEAFSSDAGINAMIINVQAFNARGKDARRIYEELDDFQSRKPIDVIRANRPILILDEPQKMEGAKTQAALAEFAPLFVLRCSATHKTRHNQVHRLDALDAYQQKLVKKINVRGITVQGLSGGAAYLYLEAIEVAAGKPPRARLEIEVKRGAGIKRELRLVGRNDDLHALSGELPAYRGGFVVAEIDAHLDLVRFVNGVELTAGDAVGDLTEEALRRIQIREAIRAHLQKEQALFARGVKVLTLFFIDEVARYRRYDDTGEQPQQDFSNAVRAERHVFDYVFTDSKGEQDFVRQLDSCTEVVVYAKLPRGFFIPTPVGNYNPDWAIAFQEGAVKHVYFVAETKGSMSSLQLREIEQRKIDCARRFFSRITSEQVRYDVVDGYDELLTLVQ